MRDNVWPLILFAAAAIIIIGGLSMLSQHYTLDNIKSRTVGDGQYPDLPTVQVVLFDEAFFTLPIVRN